MEEPSGQGLQDWFLALLGEVIHHAGAGTFPLGVPGAPALSPFPRPRSGLCVQGTARGTRQPLPEDKEQVIPKLSVPWS